MKLFKLISAQNKMEKTQNTLTNDFQSVTAGK